MNWNEVVEKITPSIVKIETPDGRGTGFLCFYNQDRSFCGIATANHVVQHADRWHQPIRIHHFSSGGVLLLREAERAIYTDAFRDSAVIIIPVGKLDLPEQVIPMLPTNNRLPIGNEVGWLGFPGIDEEALCFFSGVVSAWHDFRKAYFIDGVAINGISGGPVVCSSLAEGVQIVGTITAYQANRLTGETLPGLSVAQDVSHFHDIISRMKSIDEANRKKKDLEQQQPEAAAPPGMTPPGVEPVPEE